MKRIIILCCMWPIFLTINAQQGLKFGSETNLPNTLTAQLLAPPDKKNATFSEKDKIIVHTEALQLINDYQRLINELGGTLSSDAQKVKSLSESILRLFLNRSVLVYNDLDPDHTMSEYYEIAGYVSNLSLWYPDGIAMQMELENITASPINQYSSVLYTIDLVTQKVMDGNFMNRKQNTNTEKLSFRIAFSKEKSSFKNFKIVGVRSIKTNRSIDDTKILEEVNNANLSPEDIAAIQIEARSLLNDYVRNLSLLGNPNEPEAEKAYYMPAFLDYFTDSTSLLINDLEPSPSENYLPAKVYIKKFLEWYPKGINNLFMNIDSLKFGPPLKNDPTTFYIYSYGNKNFSGKFNNKTVHRFSQNMVFKIAFEKQGNVYGNFKIHNIESATLNFYQASKKSAPDSVFTPLKPARRNGLNFGLMLQAGLSSINNKNIQSLNLEKNSVEWKVTNSNNFTFGVECSYFNTNNLALSSGLVYSAFSSDFFLNGAFKEIAEARDINGDKYNKIYQASNYDSLATIKTLNIPIKVLWISGSTRKFGFFAEAGAQISLFLSKEYTTTGSMEFKGYYPYNPGVLQNINFEELGYYSIQNINSFGEINSKIYALSATVSVGINIPLGYFMSMRLGPEVSIGLSDIDNSIRYIDVFGNELQKEKTSLRWYGIKFVLNYKF